MDLLDFEAQELYFDEPIPERVSELLEQAAENYTMGSTELPLLQAYFLAPENLTVLVALHRFFFYQHRYEETLIIAERAFAIVGQRLHFPTHWRDVPPQLETQNAPMTLVRFYLLALKGMAYLNLRLGHIEEGKQILQKIIALDPQDRLNTSALLAVANDQDNLNEPI